MDNNKRRNKRQYTIFDLPIELFTMIVTDDFMTFRATIRAPGIGQLTMHEYVQTKAKEKFIKIKYTKIDIKYYVNNRLHRIDGPAIENNNGYKAWYLRGYLHRIGGPAVEWGNGDKEWYQNGRLHRIDGPAIEYCDGHKEWWRHDHRYREDGPAIERPNGKKYGTKMDV